MNKAEQRANELYPKEKAYVGGISTIARDAYLKGCEETIERAVYWLSTHMVEHYSLPGIHHFIVDFRKSLEESL